MNNLSDALVVETYHQAKALNLPSDFIGLIEKEMEERGLIIKTEHSEHNQLSS
ncbi:sporulation histidine kinase inhibitor Sda [Lentibacillus amyloliquefaciens]|uniref:sporulation histidine kinase inhibitor Sda n=1 Tax=Lentibacillus amyloliquefaciens TaxID=1472767 RepID=UPI0009E7BB6E|nr:sporulation histidine kinase inhibitor Sda [Lentibacillus amyloliquefaciens]